MWVSTVPGKHSWRFLGKLTHFYSNVCRLTLRVEVRNEYPLELINQSCWIWFQISGHGFCFFALFDVNNFWMVLPHWPFVIRSLKLRNLHQTSRTIIPKDNSRPSLSTCHLYLNQIHFLEVFHNENLIISWTEAINLKSVANTFSNLIFFMVHSNIAFKTIT